jgi:hypothetical protein
MELIKIKKNEPIVDYTVEPFEDDYDDEELEEINDSSFDCNVLTEQELEFCQSAQLDAEDGLFLKKMADRPVRKLCIGEDVENMNVLNGIYCVVNEDNARKIVREHHYRFVEQGKFIFIHTLYSHYDIGIVAQSDPYEIMKTALTNGCNYDIMTEDIIEKLQKWDNEFGIKIIAIGCDFCECEIMDRKINYKKLVEEIDDFCPDISASIGSDVHELEIKKTGLIHLWWD